MKFFADTANLDEIEFCFANGVNDGITTNPKIMESTGDLSEGFDVAARRILLKYPLVPVSLETDLRGVDVRKLRSCSPEKVRDILLEQANHLAELGNNVVIKIPICEGGLLAARELASRGVLTNITACMTPYQALRAAEVGIGYASLFANRMLDSHILELGGHSLDKLVDDPNWKDVVSREKPKFFEEAWEMTVKEIGYVARKLDEKRGVELIVGSIREPRDIHRIVRANPQVITIPTKIVEGLVSEGNDLEKMKHLKGYVEKLDLTSGGSLYHPMTQYTLEEFERAADSYRKSKL